MMRNDTVPVLKDIVLVGAGHAHVHVLRRFGMLPMPGVRLTLITREVHTPYSGMLPGLVAGYYDFDETHIDTGPLCRFAGARLYQSTATGIDRAAKFVICDNRPPVPYDILSIDIGSTPNTLGIPGAAEYAIPVKPIDGFLARFQGVLKRTLEAQGARHIVTVGGGASGVELTLAVAHRLREEMHAAGRDPAMLNFTIVSASAEILPAFPPKFRDRFSVILKQHDIAVVTGAPVVRVDNGRLLLDGHAPLPAAEVLWATAAQPPRWLRGTGLLLDDAGFIRVGATLQAEDTGDIFAAGDVAAFGPCALPKSGIYSVHSGPVLAENLRRVAMGRPPIPFKPQRNAMYLVSAGPEYAIGARGKFVFGGKWVWRWKQRVDARFVAKFNSLPNLAVPHETVTLPSVDEAVLRELPADTMRCGGGGAKIGAAVLARALGRIKPVERQEVLAGLRAGENAALIDTGGDTLTAQMVDYFRAMIDDPYLFGRIATNHALNDIYAMGGTPQTALAIATLPFGIEAKTDADLTALMLGANEALAEAGCALTGGHTSEGAELALGFAITGAVPRGHVLAKGGALTGDALILTKPLGTGVVLAADMRGQAKARWLMAAIAVMLQSNRVAAQILARNGARAATDVTGFGLMGHLAEMLRASEAAAVLYLDAVRVLPGVPQLLEDGVLSSMHPQNLRQRRAIRQAESLTHPMYPMLFDPQTAGGLLAAVPGEIAAATVAELAQSGYGRASIVGEVVEWDGAPEFVSLTARAAG